MTNPGEAMSFCTACGCERIGANHVCEGCGAEFGEPEQQEDPWVPAQARSGSWASGFSTNWSFTGASGPLPPSPVTRPDLGVGLLDSLLVPPDPGVDAWPDLVGADGDSRQRPPGRFRWLVVATVAAVVIAGLGGAAAFELRHGHGRAPLREGSAAVHPRTSRLAPSAASGHGGTGVTVAVAPAVGHNAALPQVIVLLDRYFSAINQHDYAAYAQLLDPQALERSPASAFSVGDGSTTDSGETLTRLAGMSSGGWAAAVTFTSHQEPWDSPDQSACDAWSITLYLVPQGAGYLIGTPPAGYQASYTSC
jgi:hypothetical protein